jgi:integrase
MRVAKMGYSHRVTKKDENGRIISSWTRVRKVVPEGLAPSLPPPYTGRGTLTKKVTTEREHAEWTARFLAIIDQAAGRNKALDELIGLSSLIAKDSESGGLLSPETIRQAPAVFSRFFDRLDLPVPVAERTPEPVTFERIIGLWAKHTNAPKKGRADMVTNCGRFAAWLGHDNMTRVTFENGRDYRDFLIDEGELSSGSISNHLKALKALFGYAAENIHIPSDPISRIKFSRGKGEERDDFTPEERRLILTHARDAGPVIKWCNWLSSFEGARLSEIADAHTRDIVLLEGVWVMKICRKYRSPDQRLKTVVSTREVPLHSAVLEEDFLGYVKSVGDGPLFPQLRLDGYGKRAGQASTEISDWLRNVVKITDPNKPFYSHRHTATSYLRNTRLPDGSPAVKEDVERYLTGHARKGAHAGYGKQWIETLKAAIECIPDPLADEADTEASVSGVLSALAAAE